MPGYSTAFGASKSSRHAVFPRDVGAGFNARGASCARRLRRRCRRLEPGVLKIAANRADLGGVLAAPADGLTVLIVPAFSEVHARCAREAPGFEEMHMNPIVGCIARCTWTTSAAQRRSWSTVKPGAFARTRRWRSKSRCPSSLYPSIEILNLSTPALAKRSASPRPAPGAGVFRQRAPGLPGPVPDRAGRGHPPAAGGGLPGPCHSQAFAWDHELERNRPPAAPPDHGVCEPGGPPAPPRSFPRREHAKGPTEPGARRVLGKAFCAASLKGAGWGDTARRGSKLRLLQ